MSTDRYQFPDGEIFEIVEDSEFTEFRDGHPFTYPAVVLMNIHTDKTRVCPKFNLDMLAKRIPYPVVEVDAFDKFAECFELATKGKFTEQLKSYSSEGYASYKTAVHKWVENYDSGFQEGRLSAASKTMLESFAMMLLVTVEMASKRIKPKTES